MNTLVKQKELRELLASLKKTVTVNIDVKDFDYLKDNNYSLCFAKKVQDKYTVVWKALKEYLPVNIFSWTPQYTLSGTNHYEASIEVVTNTNVVEIGLGEISELTKNGLFLEPISGGKETSINISSSYDPGIHPCVSQISSDENGMQTVTPIYVAPLSVAPGEISLTPKEVVAVWFEQDVTTKTMISNAGTNSYTFDLTSKNEDHITYKDKKWIK